MTRTIAITGATGLLGRALCLHFAAAGWAVRALARREDPALSARGIRTFRCDLPDTLDQSALEGCDALIHAAYTTRHRSLVEARRTNEAGTIRILETAHRLRVGRFVFISSLSAHPQARSYYGQSKLRLESFLDLSRDLAIRPGLVLSNDGGLFSRIAHSIRRSPVIPLFGGGRQPVQTVHIDDCCSAIARAIDLRGGLTGILSVAEPDPITFRHLLSLTADRLGRNPRFLSIPIPPALAALRFAESFGLHLPASSDNLLGLLSLRAADTRPDLQRLGTLIRPVATSIADLLPPAQ